MNEPCSDKTELKGLLKTLWGKEKFLIMSNFSFSNSVFRRLILQTRKNQGLFGKVLMRLCDAWYQTWYQKLLHNITNPYKPFLRKNRLNYGVDWFDTEQKGSAKGQPVRTAQADRNRHFMQMHSTTFYRAYLKRK